KAEVLGGGLDLAWYWNGNAPKGAFLDFGAAGYRITSQTDFRSSFATPAAVSLAVGWAGSLGDHWVFTVSGGSQSVYNCQRRIGDIEFDGAQPLFQFTLGYEF